MFLESDANKDAGFRIMEETTTKWHIFNNGTTQQLNFRNYAYTPNFVIDQLTGNVGIGTENPQSTLSVNGDVILGENGSKFLEIREITGTTSATGTGAYIGILPAGWNGNNSRVLSLEILQHFGVPDMGTWVSQGYFSGGALGATVHAKIEATTQRIFIGYPDLPSFHSKPWRIIIMRRP